MKWAFGSRFGSRFGSHLGILMELQSPRNGFRKGFQNGFRTRKPIRNLIESPPWTSQDMECVNTNAQATAARVKVKRLEGSGSCRGLFRRPALLSNALLQFCLSEVHSSFPLSPTAPFHFMPFATSQQLRPASLLIAYMLEAEGQNARAH